MCGENRGDDTITQAMNAIVNKATTLESTGERVAVEIPSSLFFLLEVEAVASDVSVEKLVVSKLRGEL